MREASPLGDGFAWSWVAEGLASHKGRRGLGMVLGEASPLGDGFAWGRVAEGARTPHGKGRLGHGAVGGQPSGRLWR